MISNQPKFKLVLLVVDTLLLSTAFIAAVTYTVPNFWISPDNTFYYYFSYLTMLLMVLTVFLFTFFFNNMYKRHIVITHYRQFILLVKSFIIGTIISILLMITLAHEYFNESGKFLLVNFVIFAGVLLIFIRVIPSKSILLFFSSMGIYKRRLLIIGGNVAAKHVADELSKDKFSEFHLVGFLDDYKETNEPIMGDYKNLGKLKNLEQISTDLQIDDILIAIDNAPYDRLIHIVETSHKTGKVVRIYSDILNVIADKMNVEFYSTIPVVMLSQYSLHDSAWVIKRLVDIIAAGIAVIILLPVLIFVAAGIKLSSKGPVFFKQTRIGKNGKPFDFYKFRSMHVGNANDRHEEFVKDFIKKPDTGKTSDIQVFKITDDPRIFKFGKFIRKTSLDEFPQLLNVLKGDMSLVGPRPCLKYEWECYDKWHKNRMDVLPGCTGLWQTLGRSTVTFEEMVILDLYYTSNMTLMLDLKILLQTLPVIFLAKGGY